MTRTFTKLILSVTVLLLMSCTAHEQDKRNSEVEKLASYISTNGQEPVDYVIEKFKNHYVVALGEDHWIKDHSLFLCDLLKAINERGDSINVDILALEFGNSIDQELADDFAYSDIYQEDLVIKILQHSADTYGWPYLEAVQIFRTVWENNQGKSNAQKTRIMLLDPPYMVDLMNNEKYKYTCSRDESMQTIIRGCLVSKKRILFYAGLSHTRKTIYGTYLKSNNIYYNQTSAGFLLKSLYPEQVFIVKLWGGLMGSNGYMPAPEPLKWERLYDGKVDEAFKLSGNKPVAFDVNKPPFSEIPIFEYYKISDEIETRIGAPLNKNTKLKDDADGIIFFKPVEEFSGSTVYAPFFDDNFVKLLEKRTNGKVKSQKEAFEYIKEQHPILSESLDSLIDKE